MLSKWFKKTKSLQNQPVGKKATSADQPADDCPMCKVDLGVIKVLQEKEQPKK